MRATGVKAGEQKHESDQVLQMTLKLRALGNVEKSNAGGVLQWRTKRTSVPLHSLNGAVLSLLQLSRAR